MVFAVVLQSRMLRLTHNAGSIAGPDGCLVKVSDAIKKPWPDVSLSATPLQPTMDVTV